jgi:Fe-S oxidoreductase
MKDQYEEIKQKNIQVFKDHAVGLIITNCPACYNILKFQYKLAEDY